MNQVVNSKDSNNIDELMEYVSDNEKKLDKVNLLECGDKAVDKPKVKVLKYDPNDGRFDLP